MSFVLVPPTFATVAENQQFISETTPYNGTTPYTSLDQVIGFYALASTSVGVTWTALPNYVSTSLITYPTYKVIRLQGQFPKFTTSSAWISRPTAANTSTVSAATYESVARPYFSAQEYQADSSISTSIFFRFDAYTSGAFQTSFYGSIAVNNNWTRKRNQVIPFVQGGSSDATTFRYPGGSLGGYVGEDIPEPTALTGLVRFPVVVEYTEGSGTFLVPPTVSSISLQIQAAGGQGGRGYVTELYSSSGGGGGGGGYFQTSIAVSAGQVISYFIGSGGSAATEGRGGDSYIIAPNGAVFSAGGGDVGGDGFLSAGKSFAPGGAAGGPVGNNGLRGTVATGSGLSIPNQTGGKGGDAIDLNLGQGGAGGNYLLPTGATGQIGTGYGAGGGGGGTDRGTRGPWTGGDGLGGRIIFKYFGSRYVFVDDVGANQANYNVRTRAVAAGWDGQTPLQADITLLAGFYMYSTSTNTPAFNYADLPAGTLVNLFNNGNIIGGGGKGGDGIGRGAGGGNGGESAANGANGGPAIVLGSLPLNITNTGYIAGGGGGGAGTNLFPTGSLAAGGGGAGGGDGGTSRYPPVVVGGAGGGPGQTGARGATDPNNFWGGGGGGGRILPGVGGVGGGNDAEGGNEPQGGFGGGAGGGGGGSIDPFGGGTFTKGGAGGSANNNGANGRRDRFGDVTGAGGGGWGAAGGSTIPNNGTYYPTTGGLGGKAIETNGRPVYFSSIGTIYGLISGSSSTLGFSAAVTSSQQNFNVRSFLVNTGWDQATTASAIIPGGTYMWSNTTATAGLIVTGSFPRGITIYNDGYIIGRGGEGGGERRIVSPPIGAVNGFNGGPAISTTLNLRIYNNSYIAGGGGGGGPGVSGNSGGAGGGGGGAGGGAGGSAFFLEPNFGWQLYPGAAGGGIGSAGANAAGPFQGGGGGRILPGTGGAGMFVTGQGGSTTNARGGGAGGGGGGWLSQDGGGNWDGGFSNGTAGGAGNAAAASTVPPVNLTFLASAGGGGWGAAGGNTPYVGNLGGTGGKSIELNGNNVTFLLVGNIWGTAS